ncbi:MAG: RNA polymerase subunit sigma-24 [Verrucomicrobia bacterium]|nr:MAG: RNA polymerase subunit sigma-24 [Verrucomicrobiota bacterium]PYT45155.1 MAG: RNA polymerase subunit sigma-24 [Acidobacteriota bacterium]
MRPTGTVPVALLEDTKVGDVAAFASLYSLYKRGVHALCLRMTGDVLDAEDLTQEVFLQIHRKIKTFRGDAAFGTWLYRVATNIVLMHLRKRHIQTLLLDYVQELQERPNRVAALPNTFARWAPVERIALARALGALPQRRRTVVLLHDIKGLSHAEVAACLGIKANTSKSQLHHAHRSLRDLIRGPSTSAKDLERAPKRDDVQEMVRS